jgi:putative FmdB family regulatory protein
MKREEQMPTYQYRCDAGHEFTELQTIHEEPLTECKAPHDTLPADGCEGCGIDAGELCGAPCHRVICAPNFSFKGGAPTPIHHRRGR